MDFLFQLANHRNDFLDVLMQICTYFGEEIVLVGIFAICYWCINKRFAYKMVFSYFLSGTAVQTIKIACRIPRPWVRDPAFKPVQSAVKKATGYSFPSAHTQSCSSIYGTIAFNLGKVQYFILLYLLIGVVMFSRMYLGCHTPADVLVAFAVTTVITFIVHIIYEKAKPSKKLDVVILLITTILPVISVLYTFYVVKSGKSTEVLTIDAVKAAGGAIGFSIGWFIEKNYIDFDPKAAKLPIQILKVVIGLAGALFFKSIPKMIFATKEVVDGVTITKEPLFSALGRYFLVALWVFVLFPLIIKKFLSKEK